jgi:lipopolysaccharide biosynthesis glycosyltransferase
MNTVHLFFACDDAYAPFLSVTLTSIRANRNLNRRYVIRVLHTGMSAAVQQRLKEHLEAPEFILEFPNISSHVEAFSQRLHTRDYYSCSTYYRLFIPQLYPQLSKALYLDCDLVLLEDVAQLYDLPLGDDLVGAVPDGIVNAVAEFKLYVQNRLDMVRSQDYFNAGVLLMNLDAMRRWNFADRFLDLLGRVTFRVGQDQDYLNVLCQGKVRYLGNEWNAMPTGVAVRKPKLIHYNMDAKPWKQDGVRYEKEFWTCAAASGFLSEIQAIRNGITIQQQEQARYQTLELIRTGLRQAMDHRENDRIHKHIRQVVGL